MADKSLDFGTTQQKEGGGFGVSRISPLLTPQETHLKDRSGAAEAREDLDPSLPYEKGKVRLSLDVSVELNQLLESLSRTMGVTKSDVLRKAIVLIKVALDAKLKNKKLAIVDEDQPVQTEIVGLF